MLFRKLLAFYLRYPHSKHFQTVETNLIKIFLFWFEIKLFLNEQIVVELACLHAQS